jgi:hypothetical protein
MNQKIMAASFRTKAKAKIPKAEEWSIRVFMFRMLPS